MKRNAIHHPRRRDGRAFDSRANTIFSDEEPVLVQRMAAVGMKKETAIWLIEVYGVEWVKRHLDGLPYWLRAAIEEDWATPATNQTFPFATKEEDP